MPVRERLRLDRSIETQEEAARRVWEGQAPLREAIARGELFKRCRNVLALDVRGAADGPLAGILTERRLRRCEKGQVNIPPKAWKAFAKILLSGKVLVGSDLVEQLEEILRGLDE